MRKDFPSNLFVFQMEGISFQNILEGNAFPKQAVIVGRISLPSALEGKPFQSDLEGKTFQFIDFGAGKVFLPVPDWLLKKAKYWHLIALLSTEDSFHNRCK